VAFLTSIVLTLLAIALLVAAVASKRRRKLLVSIAAVLLVVAGWNAITSTGFLGGLFFVTGSIAVIGAAVYWAIHMLGRMTGKGDGGAARLSEGRRGVLGRIGVATSPLRPTGTAEIDGSRLSVSTEGEYIAAGSYVRVVAKDSKQYFVRLAEPTEVVEAMTNQGR
jgi:membrane-bound serine protease (ClpP class)